MPKSLPHQIAANCRWSREDPTAQGIRMRDGLEAKFLREVDPDNELPEAERLRRAEKARQVLLPAISFGQRESPQSTQQVPLSERWFRCRCLTEQARMVGPGRLQTPWLLGRRVLHSV